MKIHLSTLVDMQKVDDKISEFEHQKVQLPKQLAQLIQSVKNAEQNLAEVEQKLEENALTQKNKEAEVKANSELRTKYLHQLDGIKNNKEYKALNSQISKIEETNKQIETNILVVMEEETTLKKQKTEAINLKKLADDNLKANEDLLNLEIRKVDDEIVKLKEKRTEYSKLIPIDLVKKYIQLIKNKNRKAVVYNVNSSCSGCGFRIRPQLLIELNNDDKLLYCENCGRMLVNIID